MNFKSITRLFQTAELINVAIIIALFVLSLSFPHLMSISYQLGKKYGTLSLLLLGVTLTPGILKRLHIFQPLLILLAPHRRHLGISTYIAAVGHYCLVTLLPSFSSGTLPQVSTLTFFGFVAFFTMTLLFVTSNDFSVKLLGNNWGRLHKLVYLLALFLLIHLAVQPTNQSLIAVGILAIEIISYLKLWLTKSATIKP